MVKIGILACAKDFITPAVTSMVLVVIHAHVIDSRATLRTSALSCGVIAAVVSNRSATIVTKVVVVVAVCMLANGIAASIITSVILVFVYMITHIVLAAIIIASMIFVLVLMINDNFGSLTALGAGSQRSASCTSILVRAYIRSTTYVTIVITIVFFIGTALNCHTAAIIADMVAVVFAILMSTYIGITAVITDMVGVTVLMLKSLASCEGIFIVRTDCTTRARLVINSRTRAARCRFECRFLYRFNGVSVICHRSLCF